MPPSNPTAQRRRTAPPPSGVSPPLYPVKKYRSLADVMLTAERCELGICDHGAGVGEVLCQECESADGEDEMLLCDGCDRGFHMYCLRPIVAVIPVGFWLCPRCAVDVRAETPLLPTRQTKIMDFFRLQKCFDLDGERSKLPLDNRKRRRRSVSLVRHKKKRRLLPFIPSDDPEQRLVQMGSLANALKTSNMEFSEELTYMPGMAFLRANQACLEEGGMQVLSKEDKETLDICKSMVKRGECPPLMVVFDSCEGFTVEADGFVKDLTLITEYTGDVDYISNREDDDCDSLMSLLLPSNADQSLVICPDKRGNISRFINGINNHTPEGRKKQNVKCVRYNVEGESRVLLVACRDIAKGERLYYDYNGYENAYPTHHFV